MHVYICMYTYVCIYIDLNNHTIHSTILEIKRTHYTIKFILYVLGANVYFISCTQYLLYATGTMWRYTLYYT